MEDEALTELLALAYEKRATFEEARITAFNIYSQLRKTWKEGRGTSSDQVELLLKGELMEAATSKVRVLRSVSWLLHFQNQLKG